MLGDYAVHGAVLRRYSRSVSKLDGQSADVVARFQVWLRAADRAASTVRVYGTVAGEFVAFAGTRGGLARCDAGMLQAFVATLAGYQVKTVEQKLCAVRSFLGSPPPTAWSTRPFWKRSRRCAPASRPGSRRCGIPATWPGSSTRSTGATRAGNGTTRSFLLVTRLGLRGIDVKRLEFADFDWPGNRLSVAQAKTGHRVQLPLLKEVGWAVIDYIRHGRPVCDCPQVFLRHPAPIGPFSDQDHLHQILVKHARVAHVPVSEKRRHGMHSLRHTLATRLMEDGTPIEQIADILGHQSVQSTGVYLKSSLGLLARCALDPDEPVRGVTMTAGITHGRRDHGAGRGETRCRLQVRRRGAGAGPVRGVLPQRVPRAAGARPGLGRGVDRGRPAAGCHPGDPADAWSRRSGSWPDGLDRRGVPAYVLPTGVLPRPARYVPHIYTDQELAALFAQTDRCHYCSQVPFRHLVMPVLFRTIYACGLRASEARLLRVDDVDLDAGVLQIRDAKGGKDRQVPVSRAAARQARRLPRPASPDVRAGTGSSPARPGSR